MARVEIAFENCRVLWWNQMYMETVFPDGSVAPALFIEDDEQRARTYSLGYGNNVRRMHFEHELLHTFLAEAMGLPHSPILAQAAGLCTVEEPWHEEARVLAFQRYVNDGTYHYDLACIAEKLPRLSNIFKTVYRPIWECFI